QEERERALADQRRRLEAEALRQRLIEERVHAEELERLNRELADADRRKDEFLAILAHELRNPLAPLVTGLAILEGAADKRDIARTVETMSRQTNHLVRLVDDLLDVSRITRGKMELRRAPVRAGEVIDHAVSMAMPELAERHHELLQRRSCDDLMLVADEVRLAQVICNLLCNAARYTDPGGRIELEVSRADGGMAVAVTDNGRGIAPEMIGRVFEPFVQGETGGVGGLGLGLSLVRALTEGHGGTVRAHSDGPGAGSRFEVWLPAGDEASAGDAVILPRRRDTSAPPATGPLHVVLIEDNDDVREMTGELLRMWGHRISEAACGAEGIDLITREKPDVALVDLGLPDIEGYAVARAVRENLGDDSPRLVALSGFGQAQDRARSFEVGFDEHLAKPASTSDLKRVIVPRHASRTA
ncbi:MAG TPA: hybrid sensor histidine kinase/response regulator, partial [Kofleriaceae bacterium]|nr:hybrid sensor histidine kinase/response regulator [Kofleriaceae bacterium]